MNLALWMRRYAIRTRMLVGIAMALGLVLLVGAAGLVGLWQQRALAKQFHAQTYTQVRVLQQVELALYEMRLAERAMVQADKEEVLRGLKASFDREFTNAGKELQQLSELGAEREVGKLARDVQQRLAGYGKAFEPVAKQLLAGGFDGPTAADRLLRPAHDALAGLMTQFRMLHGVLDHDARRAEGERDQAMWMTMAAFAAIVVVAIAIIVPLTMLNSATITSPMSYACRVAGSIAEGDLSLPIRLEGSDEAAHLLQSLASMQASLRRMVERMQESSAHIQAAATQVMEGQQELSGRTEETAGSLQHTAANLSQMTSTVRHTADSAAEADEMAASARAVATRGGEVVAEVVTTMEKIHASSSQIAHIIGVIDEIAFQTNILALNAAVEAARAGEQGRGFAVVASEVRSLAQRSAEAAKEVKQLIDSSVDAVETGTRLVREAGNTMTEIQASVAHVSESIAQISAAAAQQSAGMGQIDEAVSQLDKNTQLNADLVRQTSRAASTLGENADQLIRQVGGYVLRRQDTAAPFAQLPAGSAHEPDPAGLTNHHAPAALAGQAVASARASSAGVAAPAATMLAPASAPAATAESDWEEF